MDVRFSLRLKISAFAALLAAATCAAVWHGAVYAPALRERAERESQYSQLALMLGASGALLDTLTKPAIHPDLAYVIRAPGGTVSSRGSVAHAERLALLEPRLAARFQSDPDAALRDLHALRTGEPAGLVVKRVRLRTDLGDEELVLGFSTRALDAHLRATLVRSAVVLVIALVAAFAGAALIASRIAKPARELAAAMARVGAGSFEAVDCCSRDEIGMLARSFNEMARGLRERERLRGTLARYVSEDVAARILDERSDLDLQGELREVTTMFLDFRGFTSVSERLSPRDVVAMLNAYFERIVEVVDQHHGTVNKFIGDAVMAIFGAPRALEDAPMRAVHCAIAVAKRIALYNDERRQQGLPIVAIGIGINTGLVVAGNVGSDRRLEYTVIGDEVNLAQRLEDAAGPGEILISHATFERVRGRIGARARGDLQVRGRSAPVMVHEVVGLEG